METSTEISSRSTHVATRTAHVLADPEVWSQGLEDMLRVMGFELEQSSELPDLFEAAREHQAHLLVLAHRNAPFAVRACRVIRGLQDIPMIVVMPSEADLIAVLDAGADDAVIARTQPDIFAARIRALLRRSRPASRSGGVIRIRDLEIDFEKYQVNLRGETMPLTPTEFRILAVLAQQAGRVVDPRALLSAVHQHDYSERDAQNLVKVHIANLRRKLNDSRSHNAYILCVRGFGYMLERRSQARDDDPLGSLIDHE